MAVDKNKALETALTQIEKQFGKGAVMRLGENKHMNIEHISTGSLSLDIALGIGGLPRGRIVASGQPACKRTQKTAVLTEKRRQCCIY
jgi:recombination protein RecA